MKKTYLLSLVSCLCVGNADADSFLTAQSFPTTIGDATFVERVENKRAGYDEWESKYVNGKCVTNCVYPGITIEKTEQHYQRLADEAMARAQIFMAQYHIDNLPIYTQPTTVTQPTTPTQQTTTVTQPATPTQQTQNIQHQTSNIKQCSPHSLQIPATQQIPLSEPLDGKPSITSKFGNRPQPTPGASTYHKGIDYGVPTGTNVYAPAGGTVKSVSSDRSCGNGLRIVHADGFETAYCHLSSVTVATGQRVDAGCLVAKTGNTGVSTAPHLHYGIFDARAGDMIPPERFFKR